MGVYTAEAFSTVKTVRRSHHSPKGDNHIVLANAMECQCTLYNFVEFGLGSRRSRGHGGPGNRLYTEPLAFDNLKHLETLLSSKSLLILSSISNPAVRTKLKPIFYPLLSTPSFTSASGGTMLTYHLNTKHLALLGV
jgi:hypothetical protein